MKVGRGRGGLSLVLAAATAAGTKGNCALEEEVIAYLVSPSTMCWKQLLLEAYISCS